MSKVSVLIATYGDDEWGYVGTETASNMAQTSGADEVIHIHDISLADARNKAARIASGDFIVFLDADDSLQEGYCDRLREYVEDEPVLYKPAVSMLFKGKLKTPTLYKRQDLYTANELVVGTAMPREIFTRFDPSLDMLEDWDMFMSVIMEHEPAIKDCPEMVYIYNKVEGSRNDQDHREPYKTIVNRYNGRRVKIRRID